MTNCLLKLQTANHTFAFCPQNPSENRSFVCVEWTDFRFGREFAGPSLTPSCALQFVIFAKLRWTCVRSSPTHGLCKPLCLGHSHLHQDRQRHKTLDPIVCKRISSAKYRCCVSFLQNKQFVKKFIKSLIGVANRQCDLCHSQIVYIKTNHKKDTNSKSIERAWYRCSSNCRNRSTYRHRMRWMFDVRNRLPW